MTTDLFPCLFYVCPNCNEKNTVRSQSKIIKHEFRCRQCKINHTVNDLIDYYGGVNDSEDFDFAYAEFMCDCGETNLLKLKKTITEFNAKTENGEIIKINKVNIVPQKVGICNSCWQSYELKTITPEETEKHFKR